MVVLKTRVRASSVPAGYISSTVREPSSLTDMSQNNAAARRISNSVRDDTDALLSASKRHDRELLSDINNRLANASFQQPVVVRRSSVSTHKNKPPSGRVTSSTPVVRAHLPGPVHRRFVLTTDDDDDVTVVPPTPVTASVIRSSRAASVPPVLGDRLLVTHGNGPPPATGIYLAGFDGLMRTPRTRVTPPRSYHKYLSRQQLQEYSDALDQPTRYELLQADSKPLSHTLTPGADLAIKQAHRNLDRIQKEMKYSSADEKVETTGLATKSYVEVGPSRTRPAVPAYRASSLRTSSQPPPRTYQRYVSPSPTRDAAHSLLQLHSPALEQQIKAHVYHNYKPVRSQIVDYQLFPTDNYRMHVVPSITTDYSDSSRSRLLNDTLPLTVLPVALASSEYTYTAAPPGVQLSADLLIRPRVTTATRTVGAPVRADPLAASSSYAPLLHSPSAPRTPSTFDYGFTDSVSTAPISTAAAAAAATARSSLPPAHHWQPLAHTIDSSPIPQPSSGRPKLSETRRKVREVLCKVKNDPHYFD